MINQTRQKWFANFHKRDFLPNNVPRLDRPDKVDHAQTKTVFANNQCMSDSQHLQNTQIMH